MSDINNSAMEIRRMDEYALLDSPVHRLNSLAKLLVTIVYIFVVASFDKYAFSGLFVMILYPVTMFTVAGFSFRTCFVKFRFVLPLVLMVGIFNPFFDREPVLSVGPLIITGGIISMATLMLKGVLCVMASFIFAATTSVDSICKALRKLHVPNMFVTLFLLTCRYVYVLIDEVSIMFTAYKLRAPGQKGIRFDAWGSFLGQLLLRSMDRAEELYSSMCLRGFSGEYEYADSGKMKLKDWIFLITVIFLIVILRKYNLFAALGSLGVQRRI